VVERVSNHVNIPVGGAIDLMYYAGNLEGCETCQDLYIFKRGNLVNIARYE
jgi:hypothetical protein